MKLITASHTEVLLFMKGNVWGGWNTGLYFMTPELYRRRNTHLNYLLIPIKKCLDFFIDRPTYQFRYEV